MQAGHSVATMVAPVRSTFPIFRSKTPTASAWRRNV